MAGDIKLNDNGVVVEGGELHTSGPASGFSFTDRKQGDALRWVWYADQAAARLWSQVAGIDVFVINQFLGLSFTMKGNVHIEGDITSLDNSPAFPSLHVKGGEVHTSGPVAAFSFADRASPPDKFVAAPHQGERWSWYAQGGQARLWSNGDRMTIHPKSGVRIEGNLQVTGAVTQASSIALKSNVTQLSAQQAMAALQGLHAVTFTYKEDDTKEQHVGFIAEEVPELIARADRKTVSAMDIVGVLTKVVQEQQRMLASLGEEIRALEQRKGGA
jgi:hypothetical protein